MLRKLVGMLMIALVNGNLMAWLPQSITQPKEIIDLAHGIYGMIDDHGNATDTEINTKMLKDVSESSNELDVLSNRFQISCIQILTSLLAENFLEDFQIEGIDLCKNINKVNQFFEKSREYGHPEKFGEQTLENFGHEVLWGDVNLPDTLNDIRESIIPDKYSPGLLELIYQQSTRNVQYDCDSHSSVQQKIYYIYVLLIITDLKGLLTQQQIYLTKRLAPGSSHEYIAELDLVRKTFEKNVEEYHTTFVTNFDRFALHVRRCDAKKPTYGSNIIEMVKFSRFTFFTPRLNKHFHCYDCPSESQLEAFSASGQITMYNCKNLGRAVTSCPARRGSHREHLWWKDDSGIYYGHNTSCDQTERIRPVILGKHRRKLILRLRGACIVCACSRDQNMAQYVKKSTNWRISITDQMSDMRNNQVVTGVKFVVFNYALHLQIYQANFSHAGLVENLGMWKELNVGPFNSDMNQTAMNMSYELLRHERKSLYLDDIQVPEGNVVTGVRFRAAGDSAFKLQVQATPFKFETGELTPSGSNWLDASTNPMRPIDYEHKRVEINLDNSDDPTKCTEYDYDLTSNKLVKFTHTDIYKDAGQTTIPLLDAQPVITQPSFPLSGIGLSYRGKKGFGGYVTPRIYTISITKYLRSD